MEFSESMTKQFSFNCIAFLWHYSTLRLIKTCGARSACATGFIPIHKSVVTLLWINTKQRNGVAISLFGINPL